MPSMGEDASRSTPDALIRRRAERLGTSFVALVVVTFVLIVLGALVRAHGAGLACPDWPLCFGRFVPEMNLHVALEWSHRVLAGAVSILFATLAALALRHAELRPVVRGLLIVAGLLLLGQVILGALTVWQLLAAWTVTAHLLAGNSFNVCLLLLAVRLREFGTSPARVATSLRLRVWVGAVAGLLLLQVGLGGWVSSTFAGLACPEWPTCHQGAWFPSLRGPVGTHLLHRWNGLALIVAMVGAVLATRGFPRVGRPVRAALAIGLVQMAVGVANVLLRLPVEITGLHTGLAAALVLATALAVREAWARP